MNRLPLPTFPKLLLLGSFFLFFSRLAYNQSAMQLMTFNIRYDNPQDGLNAWPHRKQMVADLILREKPDILGVQEALAHQVEFLEEALPAYDWYGLGRDDGQKKGEYCPVFFQKAKFEVLEKGTFWLSETPQEPGLGWDAACNRLTTWLILKHTLTGDTLAVFNTHFDHRGEKARIESANLLLAEMQRIAPNENYFLMGDFNCQPGSAPHEVLVASPQLVDAYEEVPNPQGPVSTFNGFGQNQDILHIDYLYFNPTNWRVLALKHLPDQDGGRYPSDHLPVVGTFQSVNQ